MGRSAYSTDRVTKESIEITDLDGRVSVTNDAENVVAELVRLYGNRRVFYIDSMGNRDELVHNNGVFTGYAPART